MRGLHRPETRDEDLSATCSGTLSLVAQRERTGEPTWARAAACSSHSGVRRLCGAGSMVTRELGHAGSVRLCNLSEVTQLLSGCHRLIGDMALIFFHRLPGCSDGCWVGGCSVWLYYCTFKSSLNFSFSIVHRGWCRTQAVKRQSVWCQHLPRTSCVQDAGLSIEEAKCDFWPPWVYN